MISEFHHVSQRKLGLHRIRYTEAGFGCTDDVRKRKISPKNEELEDRHAGEVKIVSL